MNTNNSGSGGGREDPSPPPPIIPGGGGYLPPPQMHPVPIIPNPNSMGMNAPPVVSRRTSQNIQPIPSSPYDPDRA